MTFSPTRFPLLFAAAAVAVPCLLWVSGCGTTSRPLPKYEPPLPRADVQTVRTTAYTHTESDHVEYGNRNALGGTLRAAGPALVAAATPVVVSANPGGSENASAAGGFRPPSPATSFLPASSSAAAAALPATPAAALTTMVPGSAAADWSRWPAGTVFRLVSTGQLYQVDDYGWALSGRNTIDLYLPTRAAMNAWSVRREAIQIVRWGDPEESLRLLRARMKFRHVRRMVLELEGNARAAARLD